jgi:hypothetical protein
VIRAGNRARAVLLTYFEIRYAIDKFHHEENAFAKRRNGQAAGEDVVATHYFMDDLLKSERYDLFWSAYQPSDIPYIRIYASDCLIDENIPLRYGLQSAFDGDPATSYVENTEDDLIKMDLMPLSPTDIIPTKISVINGYAQNQQLYYANNRIKSIADSKFELRDNLNFIVPNEQYHLRDGILRPQILNVFDRGLHSPRGFWDIFITDIYRGSRYNDTCIAELDIYFPEYGWLFGGEDDE